MTVAREWRNRQTRTFEGRVVIPYGFKSRLSHHPKGRWSFQKASSLLYAAVAELADALDSGSSESNFIRVQVPSAAPNQYNPNQFFPVGDGFGLFIYFDRYETTYFRNGVKRTLYRGLLLSSNPYTWRFKVHEGPTVESFDAIFDQCGIWHMMNQLGLPEATPALCRYDYGMTKLTNTVFTREQTLAGGGSVCDCHYQKKK